MNVKEYYRKAFWKSLPTKSYIKLLVAVFFIFSALGFVTDLFDGAQQSIGHLLLNVLIAGIISVGYAHGAMRNWKIIIVTLSFHLLIAYLSPGSATVVVHLSDAAIDRLTVDGFGIFLTIMLGYAAFIIFISGEGVRQVRLKTEMDLAKEMHSVLAPPFSYNNERFEIYGESIPTSEVGGDLADFYESENELTCYMADVSGHGVGAGLLMGMFKSAMRTALQENNPLPKILNSVNGSLHSLKKASMFLTVAVIRFDETSMAEFSIAGHLPILHYRAATKSIQPLSLKQIPISVKTNYEFKTEKISYAAGDSFLFLTDGITEVTNGKNQEFGIEKVITLFRENQAKSGEQLFNLIIDAINSHGNQYDDQTMMIIHCR